MLDKLQKQVVESDANHILVIAGAGSGKTRCLTERVKYLLNSGVEPNSIVAITFTNMAAEEMRERLCDIEGIGDTFIGTIHSFANRILKSSGEKYKLYTDELDIQYHVYLIGRYCRHITTERYGQYRKLLTKYNLGQISEQELNSFWDMGEYIEYKCLQRSADDVRTYIQNGGTHYLESIETLCIRDNVITFDELLIKADEYFRSLNTRINHLLVDEFQDIGNLEWGFIRSLNAEHTFFIGDDYQAIYGFKGSNVNIFKSLASNSKYKRYTLSNNYRNSTSILETAENVISQVPSRIIKTIVPKNNNVGSVKVYKKNMLESIGVPKIKSDKNNYKDWFILTRSNKELFDICCMCDRNNIPYTTFKREGMSLQELREQMSENTVKILTVHASKGLENKNVILYGNFPIKLPHYRKDEEERRVMYVGITRAIDTLLILN